MNEEYLGEIKYHPNLSNETIAVNAVVMNKLSKSWKPGFCCHEVLKKDFTILIKFLRSDIARGQIIIRGNCDISQTPG